MDHLQESLIEKVIYPCFSHEPKFYNPHPILIILILTIRESPNQSV